MSIEGLPANKIINSDSEFKVIFDRVLSAYPAIKVKGTKGTILNIKSCREMKMILSGREDYFEFPFMDEIVPSFTVELSNVSGLVQVIDVGAIFTSLAVSNRGTFTCSDKRLNEIWLVSRWTVQICLHTHHLDSPNHQEPISDWGDYVIEAMVCYYAFGEYSLARQDLRKFGWLLKNLNYRNMHTSYVFCWLQTLLDYYDFTGDKAIIPELTPYVHELLDTFETYTGKNGLISEAPDYMFMDWINIGGFNCHHPPTVIGQGYLSAFYASGLQLGMRIAKINGEKKRIDKYSRLLSELKENFNQELWNEKKSLYRDGKPFRTSVKPGKWLPPDKKIETFSPHVNLLAVLYDLAPEERQKEIVLKVLDEKPLNTQPWFMHWVFAALDHVGLFEKYGIEQLHRWKIVPETKSFFEMWHGGDLSHGWCSTPLVQMSSRILGVTPLPSGPGFKKICIRPQPCSLTWAKGIVPTPKGDVLIDWKSSKSLFEIDIFIPTGMTAKLILPAERFPNPMVVLNGQLCSSTVKLGKGKHHAVLSNKKYHGVRP